MTKPPEKKPYRHCSRMRRLIEASKEERPRSSPAEHLLGKEGVDGSTPSLGSTVTDNIDEICAICLKQSIMPFWDGMIDWCSLKCKSCGQSYACEHRNSWSGEYRENHVPSEEILEKARGYRRQLMDLPTSRFSVRELWHITSEPDVERVWILEALWDKEKPKP